MALISCPECKREVSDHANSCPSCGCPISGGGNSRSSALDRRVKEYENAGFKVLKQNGDTVELTAWKFKNYNKQSTYVILGILTCVFNIFLVGGFFVMMIDNYLLGALLMIIGFMGIIPCILGCTKIGKVVLSLNRDGKVIESGNILKNR